MLLVACLLLVLDTLETPLQAPLEPVKNLVDTHVHPLCIPSEPPDTPSGPPRHACRNRLHPPYTDQVPVQCSPTGTRNVKRLGPVLQRLMQEISPLMTQCHK